MGNASKRRQYHGGTMEREDVKVHRESHTPVQHKCSKCEKIAVVIENQIYFCGLCYCFLKGIKVSTDLTIFKNQK